MHILDFIVYVISLIALWKGLDYFSDGSLTNDIGGFVGIFIVLIYTIVYIILFGVYPDWNWIDLSLQFSANFTW